MTRQVRSIPFLATALFLTALGPGSTRADAQRSHPVSVQAGEPAPSSAQRGGTPYPGASVYVEPGWMGPQPPVVLPGPMRRHPGVPQAVYYYPVPVGYPVYQPVGYGGGGVYDTNGRPLSGGFDSPVVQQHEGPLGTPDLSGAPYVAVEGGAMFVDFGNGDRRTFASCAAAAATSTPDGQSRTVFYRPASGALVLRPGQRGRVLGTPPAGAWSCYQLDQYGRTTLAY